MKNNLSAFIDSYEDITVLLDQKARYKGKSFYLYDNDRLLEELSINYQSVDRNYIKFGLKYNTHLDLTKEYILMDDLHNSGLLYTGSIVRTSQFESEYYYDGPLGISYHPCSTVFRIWTPVAHHVRLEILNQGQVTYHDLTYREKGLWQVEVAGDLDKAAYIYWVKVFDQFVRVQDPYAIASSANGQYNYVVDPEKFYRMQHKKPSFSGNYTDAVVYEASIRDLTCQRTDDKKGSFQGVFSKDNPFLDEIQSLGITHLQLMPVFDFGGVDDLRKDDFYNWGYNPEQYFVPSGWYAQMPDDPYERINSLLQLIDSVHQKGMRVIMDVVFNHVYEKGKFPFDLLVPGYFYRVDLYGNPTNTSGCGNDLATESRMCSKYIVDNLKFWAQFYHMSGFRFDLMGLLDIETLNKAYEELKKIEPQVMVYGEGWNMPNTIPDAYRPHYYNHYKMPSYGFFNDKYRDTIKGSQWMNISGYAGGGNVSNYDLFHLLTGSCLDHFRFDSPHQTINYVECHDNYTMFDFLKYRLHYPEKENIDACRLALQMIVISQGVPFIHAGEEYYRTKKGVENSYHSPDEINLLDQKRKEKYLEDRKGLKDLLSIRKEYREFRLTNVFEIEKRVHFMQELSNDHVFCYLLEGIDYTLTVCIKNTTDPFSFYLPQAQMIFNGRRKVSWQEECYHLDQIGVYIFKESKEWKL